MRYALMILTLGLCSMPLMAQGGFPGGATPPDPSAEKESFVIQPGTVERGARNAALRFVSNQPGGFSNSSSKPPALTFGAGVTLVSGSFQLLNQNEAQCAVDVDNEVAGTVEVKLEMFSVNGTTTLETLRGTLGITGTAAVAGSQAQVGAESVLLVQVNSSTAQPAGVIVIKGAIAGAVSITAPTGCNFSEIPKATIDSGDINSPALAQANTVFNFAIGNAALDNITVRVEGIKYTTQFFGLAGGVEGELACEVTGAALSNQSALVVNAFTARTTIEGSNDNSEPAPAPAPDTSSEASESTSTAAPTGSVNTNPGSSRSLESSNANNRNRNNRTRNTGNTGGFSRSTSPAAAPSSRQPGGFKSNTSRPPNASPNNSPTPGGGGGASNAGGTGGEVGGTGYASEEPRAGDREDQLIQVAKKAKKLQVTAGLHFCDKDFNPITALVLDKAVAGEAGGRVWIVLKLKKDKNPEKVETVTVKLSVNGTTREMVLTETSKNSGEFRCGKDGILVVTSENPDSNAEDKGVEPPKPRFTR